MMATLIERVLAKVSPEPNTGCWLFDGAWSGPGYGVINDGGRLLPAHRVMFEATKGPISPGLDLDHLCRVRCCVNPDHLEPVTRGENIRRGLVPIVNAKAICINGHDIAANAAWRSDGSRYCVICSRDRARRHYHQRKSA